MNFFCVIGPTDKDKLNEQFPNGEGKIREAVKNAFVEVAGHDAPCSSGWGITDEQRRQIEFATFDDELKKSVIRSYFVEGKKLPRYAMAWHLLFEQTN